TTRSTFDLSITTQSVLVYWLVLQAIELAAAVLAFRLDRQDGHWRLLPLIVLQRFCYRQLISWVAIKATAAAIRGSLMGWGKLRRRGLGISATAENAHRPGRARLGLSMLKR